MKVHYLFILSSLHSQLITAKSLSESKAFNSLVIQTKLQCLLFLHPPLLSSFLPIIHSLKPIRLLDPHTVQLDQTSRWPAEADYYGCRLLFNLEVFFLYNCDLYIFWVEAFYCLSQACVSLSRNVGEMRTETDLLPQCWEQVNATLVFTSCLPLL